MDAHRVAIAPDPFARSNVAAGYTVGGLTFLSSVGPLDANGGLVGAGDFDAQAEQAFRNLEALLAAAGSGLDRVVKVNIYLADATHFPKLVGLRRKWFKPPYPADTVVEVNGLGAPGALIELEAIAADGRIVG
jgi:enamine deaminase RidA (YjgF/YER057c/UK114 family)